MPPSTSMGVVMVNLFVPPLLLLVLTVFFQQQQVVRADADPSFLAAPLSVIALKNLMKNGNEENDAPTTKAPVEAVGRDGAGGGDHLVLVQAVWRHGGEFFLILFDYFFINFYKKKIKLKNIVKIIKKISFYHLKIINFS
jgi:hypothetical protein